MVLFWLLPNAVYSYYGDYGCEVHQICNMLSNQASPYLILLVMLSWPILIVSIPAYFMREEVQAFWFKWMMLRYMPIACLIVFCITQYPWPHGGGWAIPDITAAGYIIGSILALSIGFLLLSIGLLSYKYVQVKRGKTVE